MPTIKSDLNNQINSLRRDFQSNPEIAVLGRTADASSEVFVNGRPGYWWVRQMQAGGEFGPPQQVRGCTIPMQTTPGTPVRLVYEEGEKAVSGPDFIGLVAQGVNPTQAAVVDPNANNPSFVNQAYITTAYGQIVEGTLYVAIRGWLVLDSTGTWHKIETRVGPVTVPAAGDHCLAVIAVQSDATTFEIQYSTDKSTLIPLDLDDLNEAWSAMSTPTTNAPLWAFELADGQTALIEQNRWADLRQIINFLISSASTGDVTGPGSSTDNAAVRYDGTTGKIIQNSGVIIDDSDNVTIPGTVLIDGDTDAVQLTVQGNGTQTALLAVFENSAGADQVTVSNLGAVVINEAGNDADTRIEGDTDANLVYTDASTDRVGIGTATPSQKLDVNGKLTSLEYLFPTPTELTLSSDTITITQGNHTVKAQTGTSDDLLTINGGTTGQVLLLRAKAGHTITINVNIGNIVLNINADVVMSGGVTVMLYYDGSVWTDTPGVRISPAAVGQFLQFTTAATSGKWAPHTLLNTDLPTMTGDSGSGGVGGAVPTPAAGDATKFLRGDATWATLTPSAIATLDDLEWFGDGSDGNVTISGSTTLTRDMYYNNLTLSTGAALNPAGYRIFVAGTLDATAAPAGSIIVNGAAASGITVGGAGSSGTIGSGVAGASGSGAANGAGTQGNSGDTGGNSGKGGSGGNAGATGGAAATSTGNTIRRAALDLLWGTALLTGGSGGGGGGNSAAATRQGGGGGAGGGIGEISARTISRGGSTAASAIQAKGGAGGTAVASANANGGGGGGGGGGGLLRVLYKFLSGSSGSNMLDASGGSGGNGNTGSTTAGDGGDGGSGGRVELFNLTTQTLTVSTGSAGSGGTAHSGNTPGTGGAGNTFRVSL